MEKYQVVKIEKKYIGTHDFENFEQAMGMFKIFVEEAFREGELNITQAVYITQKREIIVRWEK